MEIRSARVFSHNISPVNSIGQDGDYWIRGTELFQRLGGVYQPVVGAPVAGQGDDGDVTVASGDTLELAKDMYYKNLTVATGGTIKTKGYRIFVSEALSLSGRIENVGENAVGAVGGIGGLAGTLGGGCNGGAGTVGLGQPGVTANLPLGGAGGRGGTPNAGIGGVIPSLTNLGGREQVQLLSSVLADVSRPAADRISGGTGGGSGGGAPGATSGAGGGGGGVVLLVATNLTVSSGANIAAYGGDGSDASGAGNASGGGGGGGGVVLLYSKASTIPSSLFSVGGGRGGQPIGTGTVGVDGEAGFSRHIAI
jgi:hypothetical protein